MDKRKTEPTEDQETKKNRNTRKNDKSERNQSKKKKKVRERPSQAVPSKLAWQPLSQQENEPFEFKH